MDIKAENKFEIDCRELAIKKLATPMKQLKAKVEKEIQTRDEAFDKASEYKSEYEIQNAYGDGYITEEQRYYALELLEKHEVERENLLTVNSAALSILRDLELKLHREIRGFKWDSLTEAEKMEVERKKAQYMENRRERKMVE